MARSLEGAIRVSVATILGGIGGAAGFSHTHEWAVHNGQHGWLAWADAVVIEGIAVVAGLEVRRDHRRGQHRRITFPLVVLAVGFGIQMAAQVALAPLTVAGWLLAAVPALGFLVVVKLLLRGDSPAAPVDTPTVVGPGEEPARLASSRVKLPPGLAEQLTATLAGIRAQGRQPTIADVHRVARLPDAMAAQVLTELDTTNGQYR